MKLVITQVLAPGEQPSDQVFPKGTYHFRVNVLNSPDSAILAPIVHLLSDSGSNPTPRGVVTDLGNNEFTWTAPDESATYVITVRWARDSSVVGQKRIDVSTVKVFIDFFRIVGGVQTALPAPIEVPVTRKIEAQVSAKDIDNNPVAGTAIFEIHEAADDENVDPESTAWHKEPLTSTRSRLTAPASIVPTDAYKVTARFTSDNGTSSTTVLVTVLDAKVAFTKPTNAVSGVSVALAEQVAVQAILEDTKGNQLLDNSTGNPLTPAFTYEVVTGGGGSFNPATTTGESNYTAPSTAGTKNVKATSVNPGDINGIPQVPVRTLSFNFNVREQSVIITSAGGVSTVQPGGSIQFSAVLRDANGSDVAGVTFDWDFQGSNGGGSVDSSGLYTAGATAGLFKVRATTNNLPYVRSATFDVAVEGVFLRIVSVGGVTAVNVGQTLQLTAELVDHNNQVVRTSASQPSQFTFSIDPGGTSGGTITNHPSSPAGLYTAGSAGQDTVRAAINYQSNSYEATFPIAVGGVSVAVSPVIAAVIVGATQQFNATVTATQPPPPSQSVTWSASSGSINGSGLFTAPATPGGPFTITAESTAFPGTTGTAQVFVVAPGGVTVNIVGNSSITPSAVLNVAMPLNAKLTFHATVPASFGNTTVTWTKQSGVGSFVQTSNDAEFSSGGSVGTAVLVARSNADPTKLAMVTITVSSGSGSGGGTIQ